MEGPLPVLLRGRRPICPPFPLFSSERGEPFRTPGEAITPPGCPAPPNGELPGEPGCEFLRQSLLNSHEGMSEGCLGSFLVQKFSNASAGLSEACETRSACRSRIPATTRRSKKTTTASRSYRAMVRIVCLGTNGCQFSVDSCGYFCLVACLRFLPGGFRASEQWPQVPWQKL